MIFPDILQQHGARDNLPGVAHQIFEQAEFARLQFNGRAAALGGAGEEIELQIAHRHLGLHRARIAPADQRIEPCQELGEGIGLGKVIIAARAQPLDAVIDVGQRGKEEHRGHVAFPAHPRNEAQSVEPGQHAIDDRHVIGPREREGQSGFAVARFVHDVAGFFQSLAKIALGLEIVFDDKNAHQHLS